MCGRFSLTAGLIGTFIAGMRQECPLCGMCRISWAISADATGFPFSCWGIESSSAIARFRLLVLHCSSYSTKYLQNSVVTYLPFFHMK